MSATPNPPLNPDALEAGAKAIEHAGSWIGMPMIPSDAEILVKAAVPAYLAAAQPEVLANSKPNQNLEFAQPEVNTTERAWRDSAEGLDERALEIAQQSSRHMPVSDGFKTMARHLVTTYELHRQAGTRAAPPVAPPGADAILKILNAHKAQTTGHVYCNCGQQFKTDQKHRNHIAQQIAEAKNEK